MMKITKTIAALLLFTATFSACKKDKPVEPDLPKPTIEDIEIGLGHNEIGIIGADFHFNANILAGDKIDKIEIKLLQRVGEQYSKVWKHEIVWDDYKGAKNAEIHVHFDVPIGAAEGKYDFLIIVYDENGAKFEEKRGITLYLKENLPVMPEVSNLLLALNGKVAIEGNVYKKGHPLSSLSIVKGVKANGIMYLLLINKKHNHRPESVKDIDFNKAIVLNVGEHKDKDLVGTGPRNINYQSAGWFYPWSINLYDARSGIDLQKAVKVYSTKVYIQT